MKNLKILIILTAAFFTLIALSSSAEDTPSAEELAKMNAAVAKITALIADAKMAIPLHILGDQLKTSTDPEAKIVGAKIEKMADDMSSGGGGGTIPKATASSWTKLPITSGTFTTNTTAPATKFGEDMEIDTNLIVNTKGPKEVEYDKRPTALEAIKDGPTKIFIP